jgi:dethiobiotin synthetase
LKKGIKVMQFHHLRHCSFIKIEQLMQTNNYRLLRLLYFCLMGHSSIAIAGIHTGIGKTVASAVIAEALGADYWKPVQAGIAERDIDTVRRLLTNGPERVHEEAVLLTEPLSPHAAAEIDHIKIDYKQFIWPRTHKLLLVETAGGVLSPVSESATMADFIAYYQLPTLLISQNYLGSINHTLLAIEVLKNRGIHLLGIIINGPENTASETFIEQYSNIPIIARIPNFNLLDNDSIIKCAAEIKPALIRL